MYIRYLRNISEDPLGEARELGENFKTAANGSCIMGTANRRRRAKNDALVNARRPSAISACAEAACIIGIIFKHRSQRIEQRRHLKQKSAERS